MLSLEGLILPSPNYLAGQDNISESMRSILVDWLIEVSVHSRCGTKHCIWLSVILTELLQI